MKLVNDAEIKLSTVQIKSADMVRSVVILIWEHRADGIPRQMTCSKKSLKLVCDLYLRATGTHVLMPRYHSSRSDAKVQYRKGQLKQDARSLLAAFSHTVEHRISHNTSRKRYNTSSRHRNPCLSPTNSLSLMHERARHGIA